MRTMSIGTQDISENVISLNAPKGVHSYIATSTVIIVSEMYIEATKKKKARKKEGGKEHKDPLLTQKVEKNIKNPIDLGGGVIGCRGFNSCCAATKQAT